MSRTKLGIGGLAKIWEMVGGGIATFFISRFLLWWVFKRREWGYAKIPVAHVITLAFSIIVAGLANANGGSFAGWFALLIYGPSIVLWFAADSVLYRVVGRALGEATKQEIAEDDERKRAKREAKKAAKEARQ